MVNEEKVKNNGVRRKEGLLCEFNVDGRQMVHIQEVLQMKGILQQGREFEENYDLLLMFAT